MIDVAQVIRGVQSAFPAEHQTARSMLVLVDETRKARERVLDAIVKMGPRQRGTPEEQRQLLLRDLRRLETRLTGYAAALSQARPSDPIPEAVRPLFSRVTFPSGTPASERHFTPDFATPISVTNQLEELGDFGPLVSNDFLLSITNKMQEIRAKFSPLDQADQLLEDRREAQERQDRGQASPSAEEAQIPARKPQPPSVTFPWGVALGSLSVAGIVVWIATRK